MSAAMILSPPRRCGTQAGGALCFTGGPTTSTALPKTEQQVRSSATASTDEKAT